MLNNIIKKVLRESTSTKGSRGSFNPPFRPGLRKWFKNSMYPYNQELSEYVNAENHYDSLDGKMSKNNKNTFSKESKSKKIRNKDWNTEKKKNKINEWVEITSETDVNELINESNSAVTAGLYNGPMELGMKKWKGSLAPFNIEVKHSHNEKAKNTKLKNNVNKVVGVWEKNPDGSYNIPTYDADGIKQKPINEDLAVWFGTKKKPKGSKQPKGPWVNICRKKEGGGHPPCGRPEAKSKGYPKCRAAGVAAKMSDSQKRAACAQKRRAEKTNPKLGTGNKPKMVSYKPKKKLKESNLDSLIKKVLRNY